MPITIQIVSTIQTFILRLINKCQLKAACSCRMYAHLNHSKQTWVRYFFFSDEKLDGIEWSQNNGVLTICDALFSRRVTRDLEMFVVRIDVLASLAYTHTNRKQSTDAPDERSRLEETRELCILFTQRMHLLRSFINFNYYGNCFVNKCKIQCLIMFCNNLKTEINDTKFAFHYI